MRTEYWVKLIAVSQHGKRICRYGTGRGFFNREDAINFGLTESAKCNKGKKGYKYNFIELEDCKIIDNTNIFTSLETISIWGDN